MQHIAKLFMNGRSQAVRLPAAFRLDCDSVFIRKDDKTGELVLSKKASSWDEFFELVDKGGVPQDFMIQRANEQPSDRDLF